MSRTADVVVVGGGIMGVATSLQLAERQAGRVWLVEKKHLAAGSSGKSGAILRQHYGHPETIRMARTGLAFYGSAGERYGTDIGFQRRGMVFLVDPRDRSVLETNVAMQQQEGVPTQIVGEDELARIEPRGFYAADSIGCFEENAAYVDPRRAVEALARAAEERGVVLCQGETVTELRRDGERVTGIATSHGAIDAAHVVLATGPWSVALFARCGFELPLSVVRPQQAFLEPPAGFGDPIPIFADLTLGAYWKGEGRHHTRVGVVHTTHDDRVDDPDDYDEGVTGTFVAECRATIAKRLPGYARATAWGGCSALYTMTPDDHAIIGPPRGTRGVTLVTGFSGHGFKMAPAVADGVAEWILDGAPRAFPASFFDPHRFDDGRTIKPSYRYGLLG